MLFFLRARIAYATGCGWSSFCSWDSTAPNPMILASVSRITHISMSTLWSCTQTTARVLQSTGQKRLMVYASGQYRPGKANANTDAQSRCVQAPSPSEGIGEGELQVAVIQRNYSNLQECTQSKDYYDQTARVQNYRKGDWVLVRFPADKMGHNRKLSQPWHNPYQVLFINIPDITVQKVYN